MGDGSSNVIYGIWNVLYDYLLSAFTHPWLTASAIEFMFLQFPGDVVKEAEVEIVLPIVMKIIPPNASLPSGVVVNFSVTGGTATSKNIVVHACSYNLSFAA